MIHIELICMSHDFLFTGEVENYGVMQGSTFIPLHINITYQHDDVMLM